MSVCVTFLIVLMFCLSDNSIPALWKISGLVGLRGSALRDVGRTGNMLMN